ncbi:MAG: hypothetical protein VKL00_02215 [Synechococcales bacterium]|nr:hypothetical protein [Synechococcales bacterium]
MLHVCLHPLTPSPKKGEGEPDLGRGLQHWDAPVSEKLGLKPRRFGSAA